jgi:hypothetical protein
MTIWSDANPIAQFDERLPRLLGAAAERATGMKTSTWLPLAICLARANDPAECVGATGIPEAPVNPLRRAWTSAV